MKKLTLIRHAKSSWKTDATDFERPLNKRGERDAPEMGQRLAARHLKPDLLLSSPALRAITTARVIASEIGYSEDAIKTESKIYEASVNMLVTIINAIDDHYNNVIMFGHNPGFTSLGEWLSGHHIVNMPTCGVFSMQFEVDTWAAVTQQSGTVIFFDYPKNEDD